MFNRQKAEKNTKPGRKSKPVCDSKVGDSLMTDAKFAETLEFVAEGYAYWSELEGEFGEGNMIIGGIGLLIPHRTHTKAGINIH